MTGSTALDVFHTLHHGVGQRLVGLLLEHAVRFGPGIIELINARISGLSELTTSENKDR